MGRASTAWLLGALVLASCAQNSVLEIEMQLPTVGPGGAMGAPNAVVRVALDTDGPENDAATFDDWDREDSTTAPSDLAFSLDQPRCSDAPRREFPCNARLSIATTNVDADVIVQIRFCNTADGSCTHAPPELRYHIEHPFYRGQRTFFRTGPPSAATGGYTYNLADDFPELCQQPAAIDQATRFVWRCRIEGCFDSTRGQLPSPDYGWCTTADGPAYGASDACTDGASGPDAGARVVGRIGGVPHHVCETASSGCSVVGAGASRAGLPALGLFALAAIARLVTRRRARVSVRIRR